MDVTKEVLEKVKCSQCEGYLSLGPVYIKQNGEAVCRRCKRPKDQLTRNKQYEALATLVKFPCKYQELGCKEIIPFYEGQAPTHELACDYKQYLCPVVESGRCDWLGRRCEILKHCQEKHKDKVLTNPCTITHDISKFSLNTFILQAFEFLFLLHTKICLSSGKIFHSIRVLGDSDLATKFKYVLEIKRDELIQSKPGRVAPEGCLAIQEDSSLATGINSLLEFLDGYDGTLFKLTLVKLVDVIKCAKNGCTGFLIGTADKNVSGMFCDKCAFIERHCKNKSLGCQYSDIHEKCEKHETYFCRFTMLCPVCKKDLSKNTNAGITLCNHLINSHISSGKSYQINQTTGQTGTVFSDVGPIVFFYKFNLSLEPELIVNIFSPIESKDLNKYNCNVKVSCSTQNYHNSSKIEKVYTLLPLFGKNDWELKVTTPDLAQNIYYYSYLNFDISRK